MRRITPTLAWFCPQDTYQGMARARLHGVRRISVLTNTKRKLERPDPPVDYMDIRKMIRDFQNEDVLVLPTPAPA